MNILTGICLNQFIKVKDVKIPEYFYRRFFANEPGLDLLFGRSGIVPNFTFTLAAAPGTGKTTFLLQTHELLEMSGKKQLIFDASPQNLINAIFTDISYILYTFLKRAILFSRLIKLCSF